MLSLTCKTAIKAVIYLGSKTPEKAGMKEIAEAIDASEHTVGKILQTLARENVINSNKGPNGGFYISNRQLNQPILQIVKAIDGNDVFRRCGLGFSKCSSTHPCPIHNEYKNVRDLFEKICKEKTISDLCVPVANGIAHLFG